MTKETIQEIVKSLDEVYSKLSDKERLLAAYQLRYSASEFLLHYGYSHIVFDDDNIDLDSIKFCIDSVCGKTERSDLPDKNIPINLPTVELLICLSHMVLKDRIKIIYPDINSADNYFDDLEDIEEYHTERLMKEIKEMHESGYTSLEKLKIERDTELNEFIKQKLIDYDVFQLFW